MHKFVNALTCEYKLHNWSHAQGQTFISTLRCRVRQDTHVQRQNCMISLHAKGRNSLAHSGANICRPSWCKCKEQTHNLSARTGAKFIRTLRCKVNQHSQVHMQICIISQHAQRQNVISTLRCKICQRTNVQILNRIISQHAPVSYTHLTLPTIYSV